LYKIWPTKFCERRASYHFKAEEFRNRRTFDFFQLLNKNSDSFRISSIPNQYFYIFGLNKKFCDGIRQWNNETAAQNTSTIIRELILQWHSFDCSQEKEDNAWKAIQHNESLVYEYITTWKGKLDLNF